MHEDSTEEKEMKRQQKMKVMKGMLMKIRSKGRMDAENRWWVAELRSKMYEMPQHRVNQMIKSAGRQCWASAQNHEASSMERRSPDFAKRKGCHVAGPM